MAVLAAVTVHQMAMVLEQEVMVLMDMEAVMVLVVMVAAVDMEVCYYNVQLLSFA